MDEPSTTHEELRRKANYNIWCGMRQRCLSENSRSYRYYGARGVGICEEWMSFENFYRWAVDAGYRKGLSIERIDPTGNYQPDNCKWIERRFQYLNKRKAIETFEYRGVSLTVRELSQISGISPESLRQRLVAGWAIERALSEPEKKTPSIKYPSDYSREAKS